MIANGDLNSGLNMNIAKETEGIVGALGKSYWYHVFLASVFLLSLLLLFVKDLPTTLKDFLIPALAVYALGAAIIGYIQGCQFRKHGMRKEWHEPTLIYAFVHVFWFVAFIGYLFYRRVV
jgi:hypothetical protein